MRVGQTVRLKSGGPLMTAMATRAWSGHIVCAWQDRDGKYYKDRFPPETLIADDGGQPDNSAQPLKGPTAQS
jgi:uncharacterized protein YodC (DUF2158 family)